MIPKAKLSPLTRFATALAVGGAGAGLAWLTGMPAPFITGPAILVTLAGLGGVAMAIPVAARDLAFVFIGLTMGTGVTPEVLDAAGRWPVSLLLLCLSVTAIILVIGSLLTSPPGEDKLRYTFSRPASSPLRADSSSDEGSAAVVGGNL